MSATPSVLDAIYARRSIRAYTGEAIADEQVRALLRAAVQAPTAMHAEPWAFVVVQDAAVLQGISDRAKAGWLRARPPAVRSAGDERITTFVDLMASPDASIFYDATTLVVICAKPLDQFVTADCWLAAQNLMLAAVALGLGTCCIGSALAALNTADVKAELRIPDGVNAVAAIVVGVPAQAGGTAARKPPDVLSWKTAKATQAS